MKASIDDQGLMYQVETIENISCPQCSKNNDKVGKNSVKLISYKNTYQCCLSCGSLVYKSTGTSDDQYAYVRLRKFNLD